MLHITMGALEHCSADKRHIRIVCPDIWIHFVTAGKGYYNNCELGAGQGFIVYKNDLCEYYPDPKDPWTYVWIRLTGQDDENLLRRCGLPQQSGVFPFDYKDKLTQLAPAIFPVLESPDQNREFKESAAKMILSLHIKKNTTSPSWDERWVVKAKEYIAANYHTHLSVEQIADTLHIDRQYLRNLFVKHTGMSTKKYLDFYRMKRAAELLAIKETSIGIIALSVGYADQLSFSKAFKKHYGVSPTRYRNL